MASWKVALNMVGVTLRKLAQNIDSLILNYFTQQKFQKPGKILQLYPGFFEHSRTGFPQPTAPKSSGLST